MKPTVAPAAPMAKVADRLFRKSIAIRRAGLPAGHRYISDTLVALGECLTGLGRYAEAETHLLEAHRSFLATSGADDARTQRARRRLETLYKAWGKPERVARITR